MIRQTVHVVEKFVPTQCPSCRNPFTRNSQDGYLLFMFWKGNTTESRDQILKSIGCPDLATELVSCGKCHNVTLRVMLERRTYENGADAEAALAEGFVNLTTGRREAKKKLRGVEVVAYLGPQKGLVTNR